MAEEEPVFRFEIPANRARLSRMGNTILQIGALSGRLAEEKRTLVNHRDGRPENVAEHTCMLVKVATIVAREYYPDSLNAGLVAEYAGLADDLEAYTGDVPTHEYNQGIQDIKDELEKAALAKLSLEFAHIPAYVKLIREYEE